LPEKGGSSAPRLRRESTPDKLWRVPDLIETRPFTIHPEQYAWPSYRIFSERTAWIYAVLFMAVAILVKVGVHLDWLTSILVSAGIVFLAFGISFLKYKAFLNRPSNRQLFSNCIVSLDEREVRQDFPNSSYMAIQLFAVKQFREIGDFYFIFATKEPGVVLPKTAFVSPEESQEFAEKLRRAAGAKSGAHSEMRGPR